MSTAVQFYSHFLVAVKVAVEVAVVKLKTHFQCLNWLKKSMYVSNFLCRISRLCEKYH